MKKKLLIFSGVKLIKKWKNIRDNYIRESKKKTHRFRPYTSNRTIFAYYRKLQFLDSQSNDFSENIDSNENNENLVSPPIEQDGASKRKLKFNDVANQRKEDEQLNDEDDDKLFCLSLSKELKKVPENQQLSTKIEIMNLIKKSQRQVSGPQINWDFYSGFTTEKLLSTISQQCSSISTLTPSLLRQWSSPASSSASSPSPPPPPQGWPSTSISTPPQTYF